MKCYEYISSILATTQKKTKQNNLHLSNKSAVTLQHGTHSANFDEKVHKPKSKSYGSIGANKQLIFTHLTNLNTSISASQLFGV